MTQHVQTEITPVIIKAMGTIPKILAPFIDRIDRDELVSKMRV